MSPPRVAAALLNGESLTQLCRLPTGTREGHRALERVLRPSTSDNALPAGCLDQSLRSSFSEWTTLEMAHPYEIEAASLTARIDSNEGTDA